MLGIHTKYVPWIMTNITRVDAKRDVSIKGHYEVKGQTGAFHTKKKKKKKKTTEKCSMARYHQTTALV